MLRQISSRVLVITSDMCRISPSLTKLLTHGTNSRAYRGQGIDFDEDSLYDEPKARDAPEFKSNYRNRRRFTDTRTNYDEFNYQERNQSRNYGDASEFKDNYRNYRKSNYKQRDPFGNQDYYDDQSSFRRPMSNHSFGQNLVAPVFDASNLSPVKKNFYIEHPNVTQRSEDEVESYRGSLNISVRGSDIPKPITDFEELCLPDDLKKVVAEQEYSKPTPIQAQGWPIALSGRDMVGISQTGSGKTLVFVLPAIIHALNQADSKIGSNECKPQVLVLAPTRELVQQTLSVSNKFSQKCGLISACAYGGASRNYQLRFLKGANICVATPGRLIDFVSAGLVDLRQCTYLVLDEADRMLDMGFEPQIRKIVGQIRPERQTLMWSATWPREIQNLAEEFLTDYVQVTIGSGELAANPNIEQNIHFVEESEKQEKLLSLLQQVALEEGNKVLVFAQTKKKVDYLGWNLNKLRIPVMCIHGDVSQARRDQVLNTFRSDRACVLVATDVAARGLDISDVHCVINYDFPLNIEDYIHRIGRTARGDSSGVAHSFFTYENAGIAKELLLILKQANQNISPELYSMVQGLSRNRNKGNSFTHHRKHALYR